MSHIYSSYDNCIEVYVNLTTNLSFLVLSSRAYLLAFALVPLETFSPPLPASAYFSSSQLSRLVSWFYSSKVSEEHLLSYYSRF